jgi:DNA-binding transcriptional LysR family regulator
LDRFTEIELFARIAELGGLARAAESLGLSNAAASRHLSSLEERLAGRLVERSTRRLTLTDVGEAFLLSCTSVLAELKEAEATVSAAALKPSGTLRIAASVSFAVHHIAPILKAYTRRYPDMHIHVETANRYHDLIDNNIDVAIRTREYEVDSNVTIRRVAETRRILSASPGYIDAHGMPEAVETLQSRSLLIYTYSNNPHTLSFQRGGENKVIKVTGRLESNEGQVLRVAAMNGMGILVQPKYIVYDDLVAGRLISVLDDWDLPRLSINVAFQSRRHMSAKVRTFIDFLVEHFDYMDYQRKWTGFEHAVAATPAATRESPAAARGRRKN